jgi:hypothetical protein
MRWGGLEDIEILAWVKFGIKDFAAEEGAEFEEKGRFGAKI